jgi:hypothetical protein
MDDVRRAVDGPFGLIVGELPDGSIWVLKRQRAGNFLLSNYVDMARSQQLSARTIADRREAINAFAAAIHLGEVL